MTAKVERKLTLAMLTAVKLAAECRLGSWDCGAGTLGVLKREGYVVRVETHGYARVLESLGAVHALGKYVATAKGLAALRAQGPVATDLERRLGAHRESLEAGQVAS